MNVFSSHQFWNCNIVHVHRTETAPSPSVLCSSLSCDRNSNTNSYNSRTEIATPRSHRKQATTDVRISQQERLRTLGTNRPTTDSSISSGFTAASAVASLHPGIQLRYVSNIYRPKSIRSQGIQSLFCFSVTINRKTKQSYVVFRPVAFVTDNSTLASSESMPKCSCDGQWNEHFKYSFKRK